MSTPFLCEIRIFSFGFAPKGWAFANGQLLPINQNQAVFSLLGTTYGGNGIQNFALPNLQTRVPMHMGGGFTLGQQGGEQAHTLTVNELAAHTHIAKCSTALGTVPSPSGGVWATDNNGNTPYGTSAGQTMSPGAIAQGGGSAPTAQPHPNMAPYLTLSFCIALSGIYPSHS
jgi:microcystin-dependent protein